MKMIKKDKELWKIYFKSFRRDKKYGFDKDNKDTKKTNFNEKNKNNKDNKDTKKTNFKEKNKNNKTNDGNK